MAGLLSDDFGWGDEDGTPAEVAAMPSVPTRKPAVAKMEANSSARSIGDSSNVSTSSVASLSDSFPSQFELFGMLGHGAFASCYLARDSVDQSFVAVKRFMTPLTELDGSAEAAVRAEVDALKALSSHRNITTYHGCFVDVNNESGAEGTLMMHSGPRFSLVIEYCDGGTLEGLVEEYKSRNSLMDASKVWEIALQCLDALHHIHSKKIIHRDLKPANILLQGLDRRIVKLADFGVSSLAKSMATTVTGTPLYLCPEICEGAAYNTKADMWSLGCVLHELCALKKPFNAESLPLLIMQIMRCEVSPLNVSHFGEDLLELVSAMLVHDPWTRADADTLLSWDNVRKRQEALEPDLVRLAIASQEQAQIRAGEYIEKAKRDTGGATFGFGGMGSSASTVNYSRRNADAKAITSHRRVWRFGSGQHAPKLVEELLTRDIRMVSLGGVDTTGAAPLSDREKRDMGKGTVSTRNVGDDMASDDEFEFEFGEGSAGGVFNSFAFAVDEEGEVLTWGATAWESSFTSRLPRRLSDDGVAFVACGTDFSLAVDVLGRVWLWGAPQWYVPEDATANSSELSSPPTSGRHNMFSANFEEGEIEPPSAATMRRDPAVPMLVDPFGMEVKAKSGACGAEFFVVLDQQGRLWSCGDGSEGALGHGNLLDQPTPKMIPTSAFEIMEEDTRNVTTKVHSVSAGEAFCAALTEPAKGEAGGIVFTWGANDGPMLGLGDEAIEASDKDDAEGLANSKPAVCGGSGEPVCTPTLLDELLDVDAIQVSCGRRHAACLDDGGVLYTWGENGSGELGLGDRENAYYPTRVGDLDQIICVQASCGSHHTAAVTDAGELFCWGSNEYGAVGMSSGGGGAGRSSGHSRGHRASRNRRQRSKAKSVSSESLSDISSCATSKESAILMPRQVRKFGRDGLKVEFVEAGIHETLVVTRPA